MTNPGDHFVTVKEDLTSRGVVNRLRTATTESIKARENTTSPLANTSSSPGLVISRPVEKIQSMVAIPYSVDTHFEGMG